MAHKRIITIEAVRNPEAKLLVPNLHILIHKVNEDRDLWVGKCMDINVCAHSDKPTIPEVCNEIFSTIIKMVTILMVNHLKRGTAKDLFLSLDTNDADWSMFNKYNNMKKIKDLEDSYDYYISGLTGIKQEDVFAPNNEKTTKFIVETLLNDPLYLRRVNLEAA